MKIVKVVMGVGVLAAALSSSIIFKPMVDPPIGLKSKEVKTIEQEKFFI